MIAWPDADDAGHGFARCAATLARQAGAATVRVVTLFNGLPKG